MKSAVSKNGLLPLLSGLIFLIICCQNISSQEQVLSPPAGFITEGVPQITMAEVKNLFYDAAALKSNLIWDTDRKNRKLLVTDKTNDIYLLESPMAEPIKLTDKIAPNTIKSSPDGNFFAYNFDVEKKDNYEIYLFDFKRKSTTQLTNLPGANESADSFVWEADGKSIFFTKVDYDNKTSRLCRHNLISENCYQTEMRGIWNVLDARRDKVLLKYWKASGSQYLYLFDIQTNKLIPVDDKGNCRKGFFGNDNVFWTSEGSTCDKGPCVFTLNTKNNQKSRLNLPASLLKIADIKTSPTGKHLLIQESREGVDNLRVFKLKGDKISEETPQFISGSYVIWNTRWLSDEEIAYTLENVGKPASVQSFNLASRQTVNWTKERMPTELDNKIKAPEIIRWKSFDQREISGYMIRPKYAGGSGGDGKKSPVLINVHGGPQVIAKPIFNSQDVILASGLGMTMIHTNIRGSSGFTDEFMNADNQGRREDAVKDIQTLLDWVEKQPGLDSKQIYLSGESYGGLIVLATGLREPARIKGIIAEYPIVSVRGYLSQTWIDEFAISEYGDPKDEVLMSKLDSLSPVNNTKNWNNIPLLLTRGKLDSRTPEKDVVELKTQLQNKGSVVWYILSTTSGHGVGGKYVSAVKFKFLKTQINKEK